MLPEVVAQGHAERDRAVWLLPTFDMHRAFHERKGLADHVEYRRLVAREIERQAAEYDVNVLRVDYAVGPDEAFAAVEQLFADALAKGPRAETLKGAPRAAPVRERGDRDAGARVPRAPVDDG